MKVLCILIGGIALKHLNKALNHLEEYLAVASLLFTSLLVFTQALLRYGFHTSLYWSDEVARYAIIWFVFIGASIAVREKAHATVDAVTILLPAKLQKVCSILANVLGLTFCFIVILAGSDTIANVLKFGSVTPSLGISMAIPYLALPAGATLMFIRFFQLLIHDIKTFRSDHDIKSPVTEEVPKH